jgi:hypothetical protein
LFFFCFFQVILLQIETNKPGVIDIIEGRQSEINCAADDLTSSQVTVFAKFLGRDDLIITAMDTSAGKEESEELVQFYPVSVMRVPTKLDTAFIIIIAILVGINTINMGCHLDLGVVKENLKRPCAIGIGFTSQYIFMPLVRTSLSASFCTFFKPKTI